MSDFNYHCFECKTVVHNDYYFIKSGHERYLFCSRKCLIKGAEHLG